MKANELRAEPISREFKIRLLIKDLEKLHAKVDLSDTRVAINNAIDALRAELAEQ